MATNRLTWQNVAAPDFSGAAVAQRASALAFDNAMQRISGAITAFDDNRKDLADAAVMRNAMQYQNADDLQKAIASGALLQGVNPDYVRADALLKAQAQAGQLMGLEKSRQELATAKQKYNQDAELFPETLRSATLKNDGQELTNTSAKYAQERTEMRDKRADDEYAGAQEGAALWNTWVNSGQLDTPAGRMAVRQQLTTSPRDTYLAAQLKQYDPALFAPLNLGGAAGPTGTPGAPNTTGVPGSLNSIGSVGGTASVGADDTDTRSYNTVVGGKQMPLGTVTLGYWSTTIAPKLIEQTRGTNILEPHVRDEGSSASGRYQLTARTVNEIAPKVFGENWRNVPMDARAQEALGKFLYDRRINGKSSMTDEWRGLRKIQGADKVGAWDGIPWDAASAVIAQFESNGSSVLGENPTMEDVRTFAKEYAARQAQTSPSVAEVNSRYSTGVDALGNAAANGPRAARIVAAAVEDKPLQVVAKELGDITGIEPQLLSQYIDDVAKRIQQSPAVVAELLKDAPTSKSWFGWGNKVYSEDTLQTVVKDFNAKTAERLRNGLLTQELFKQRKEQSTAAQSNVDAQRSAVKALEEQAKRFPANTARGAAVHQELGAQRALLDQLVQQQNTTAETARTAGMTSLSVGKPAPTTQSSPAPKPGSTPSASPAPTTGSSNFYGAEAIAAREAARVLREEAEKAAKATEPPAKGRLVDTSQITAKKEAVANLTPERVAAMTKEEAQRVISLGYFPLLSRELQRIVRSKANS